MNWIPINVHLFSFAAHLCSTCCRWLWTAKTASATSEFNDTQRKFQPKPTLFCFLLSSRCIDVLHSVILAPLVERDAADMVELAWRLLQTIDSQPESQCVNCDLG